MPMKDLTIEITDKCSLNCVHCSTNSENKDIFISKERVNEILDEFADFNRIKLSGGEPFEHPDLDEILEEIKQKGKKTMILSSGVYEGHEIPKNLLKSVKQYNSEIAFSIYGNKEIHNQICNFNAYDSLIKSVNTTNELKIPFSFQTVAMKTTLDSLEDIVKHARKFGSNLHLLRFIKQGRGETNSNYSLNKKEISELIKLSENLGREYFVNITLGCSLKEKECTVGKGKFAIAVNGDRIYCSALKYNNKNKKFACKERW